MKASYNVYVDDGGSSQAGYVSFAGIWADAQTTKQLIDLVILTKSKFPIPFLHAKEVLHDIPKYKPIYEDLFNGLAPILSNGMRRHVWIRFGTSNESSQNFQFLRDLIIKIVKQVNLSEAECELISKPITYMLMPILELINNTKIVQQENTEVRYVIDQKNEYLLNLNRTYNASTDISSISNAPGAFLACKAINAYLKVDGKTNLQFEETILADSKKSPEIELMDSLSNFSWNWLKVEVSENYSPTPGEVFKHDLFRDFLVKVSASGFDQVTTNTTLRKGFSYDGKTLHSKTTEGVGMLRIVEFETR